MDHLKQTFAQGVKDAKIPHAIAYATNKDGSFAFKVTGGKMYYPDDKPIEDNTVFMLASQSKLITSIAALQVVEQGIFGLDDDVSEKLPELAEQPILKGFNGEDPILEQRKNKITLRHLLTHSAGTTYDAMSPDIQKLRAKDKDYVPNTATSLETRFSYPLIYEPGTSWMYSSGIDWAGRLVERCTNTTLEDWVQKNICSPLNLTTVTFWAEHNPNLKTRIPTLVTRTPDGNLAPFLAPFLNTNSEDCMGGHGMYASMPDYLKILHSILANDGKMLKPLTVDSMFEPQLSPESAEALKAFMAGPFGAFTIGDWTDREVNWGLGGILLMKDDGRRKKGALSWGGMTNPYWIVDREADLAITFGTQVLPPGDKKTEEMITATEEAVYKARAKL